MAFADELTLPVAEHLHASPMPFSLTQQTSGQSVYSADEISLTYTDRLIVQDLNDYGAALVKDGQFTVAITVLRRALAMDRMVPELWGNIGIAHYNLGDLQPAIKALKKAISLAPHKAHNYGNLALVYGALRRYDEADVCYKKVAELGNESEKLNTTWDQALVNIERGNWESGLIDYDVRFKLKGPDLFPKFPAPTWQGEDLNGKALYIAPEQGIGDRILFSRYFAYIKEQWPDCKIVTCVADKMMDFFWEFRHIVDLVPDGVPWLDKEYDGFELDYSAYIVSLPRLCGSTPTNIPADPGLIYRRVKRQYDLHTFNLPIANGNPMLKIGVAWTGSPLQSRNAQRSMPLELMLSLAENPQVALYSFQVGPGTDRIEEIGAQNLMLPMGKEFEREGFVGAGVAMLHMDLIISVCTSTVHLAGALGVPVWTLLCYDPYWIWLQDKPENNRTDSIWYPSMKLFRQESPGDWEGVMKKVKPELAKLCKQKLG